jgi:hypothetical protein
LWEKSQAASIRIEMEANAPRGSAIAAITSWRALRTEASNDRSKVLDFRAKGASADFLISGTHPATAGLHAHLSEIAAFLLFSRKRF